MALSDFGKHEDKCIVQAGLGLDEVPKLKTLESCEKDVANELIILKRYLATPNVLNS